MKMSLENSILSYPERGPYGDANYPGNCSGYLIEDLCIHFKPKSVLDPMEGSETARDVCKELDINYDGYDLKKGFNLVNDNLQRSYDLIFFHPPYWDIIKYSDDKMDLSNTTLPQFKERLGMCLDKLTGSLNEDGNLAVLIGDKRRNGIYYPLFKIVLDHYENKEMDLKNILIKKQNNVNSSKIRYLNIIPVMHEYVLLYHKRKETK